MSATQRKLQERLNAIEKDVIGIQKGVDNGDRSPELKQRLLKAYQALRAVAQEGNFPLSRKADTKRGSAHE